MTERFPHILIDAPWDGYCEARGWVEAIVPEDRARDILAEFCVDADGNYARPAGPAKRVHLRLCNPAADVEDQAWVECRPTAKAAVEFYEFDATDLQAALGRGR